MAAVDAVYPAARNAMAFPNLVLHEGLEPHTVKRLYLFWTDKPDARVDITGTIDRKIAALAAHVSQIREPDRLAERMRAWGAEEGEPIAAVAAEALRCIVIDDDDDEGPG